MGETDLTKDQPSGEIVNIPGTRDIPLEINADLVKSLYNSFCDSCAEAGLPRPPSWG